ncbi:MAG: site-specific integrase, partial [Dokdonella sp.]|uniref:tyrosine-type recombinase/integrase n=1 Tax=Dokdonella sp. TaxID=2291710 RepID=UPI0025B9B2CF
MASVRARKDTGLLLIDFRYRGERCREQTLLADTPGNRERLQKLADRIQRAIGQGVFVYADFFPASPRAKAQGSKSTPSPDAASPASASTKELPTFRDFAEIWFAESRVRWRKRHCQSMRDTLDRIFFPVLGDKALNEISRADVLQFRAAIAQRCGRGGQSLSAKRINKLMAQLKAILVEACDRYDLDSPARGIKPLKQKRVEILPFTLDEADRLISTVRKDYRPYLIVRLFTGLRTGEANGLKWCDIDFDGNLISVERTVSRGGDGDTKTEESKRIIPMVPQVRAAFEQQKANAKPDSEWVFHSPHGNPVDAVNFTNRVWYPLLRNLGLRSRPPYQMRHTAATLMLASGENPEWVAKVLGHSTTEMLFRVYSRFIPNLTRDDGRAFVGLLTASRGADGTPPVTGTSGVIAALSTAEKRALLAALASELTQAEV